MTSLSGAHRKKLKQKEFFYLQVSEEYHFKTMSLQQFNLQNLLVVHKEKY